MRTRAPSQIDPVILDDIGAKLVRAVAAARECRAIARVFERPPRGWQRAVRKIETTCVAFAVVHVARMQMADENRAQNRALHRVDELVAMGANRCEHTAVNRVMKEQHERAWIFERAL